MFFIPGISRFPAIGRLALLMFAAAVASTALALGFVGWVLRRDLDIAMRTLVSEELFECTTVYNRHGVETLREIFDNGQRPREYAVAITKQDGTILYRKPWDWPPVPEWLGPPDAWPVARHRVASLGKGQSFLWAGSELKDGNILWYGKSDAQERAFHADILFQLWIAGCMAGALTLVPIIWFSREIAEPLRKFTEQAEKIAGGGTGDRLEAPRGVPELSDFAAAFNAGLDRIERLSHSLQFANDQLAHELRTPLARLRTRLENLGEADPGVLEEIDRINRLLQTILDVRAGEDNMLFLQRESTDVASHVASLVDLYQPAAEARGVRLEFSSEGKCGAFVDRQRISQAVANLLDNALRYTPAGGGLRVAVGRSAKEIEIRVSDTGRSARRG